jgi:hypothetical protein
MRPFLDHLLLSLTICLVLAAVEANAYNDLFNSRVDYATGDSPRDVVTADFDHDGDSDLAVVNFGSVIGDDDSLTIFHNDGEGQFEMAANYIVGDGPRALCVGHFDSPVDKTQIFPDLAAISTWTTVVSVMFNDAGSGFHPPSMFWAGSQLTAIAAADLNGDGSDDLIVGNGLSGDFYIELCLGDGSFIQYDHIVINDDMRKIYTADMDGDGDQDVILVTSRLRILINDGHANLEPHGDYGIIGYLSDACIADFDGDGDPDAAGANSDNRISVWLNDGDGTLAEAVVYPASQWPNSIAASDFDRDGDYDLVAGDFVEHVLLVLTNDGQGHFGTEGKYATPNLGPTDICVGDFDGDHDDDVAVVSNASDNISIFFNRTYNARSLIIPAIADAADAYGPDSLIGVLYFGDFDNGYPVGDIDPLSILINDSLRPISITVADEVPEIPGDEIRMEFDFYRFIRDYGAVWGSTRPFYRVTGLFGDETPFTAGGEIAINGFMMGDINFDGSVDVSDPVFLINYLYREGPAPLLDAIADVNCDDAVDVSDVVYYINYIFKDGPLVTICPGG